VSEGAGKAGTTLWRYRRPFRHAGQDFSVDLRSRSDGLHSELILNGATLARDQTPIGGPDAVRNHQLAATLADGTRLEVEAGWISVWNTGIRVRAEGIVVHESHPGRTIAYPEKYRARAVTMRGATLGEAMAAGFKEGVGEAEAKGHDMSVWSKNRWAIGVDVALGLLFFVVAKLTDLPTAAILGAVVGLALVVVQRFVKVDLLGGLVMFGILMLLISAGLALLFQDDMAVKMRGTIVGLISATLFLGDGLLGGNRLGRGLARYLPYSDLDPSRLALGMGLLGLVMAALNYLVAKAVSTDVWLFYTTFVDFVLIMGMMLIVFQFARGRMLPRGYKAPSPEA